MNRDMDPAKEDIGRLSTVQRVLPGSSSQQLIVRYRPLAELEKWLAQRVDDRSAKKTAYVMAMIVVFLIFGVPLIFDILTQLQYYFAALASGAAARSAAVQASQGMLYLLFQMVFGVTVGGLIFYQCLPTHLLLSQRGLLFLWRHRFFNHDGKLIPWERITHIDLLLPQGKTSPLDNIVRFNEGTKTALSLRLGSIPSMDERARILNGIEEWAPFLSRDAAVVEALELPPDHSYTELWLQALSGPPKRERLKPLERGAALKDSRFLVSHALGVGGQGTAYLASDANTSELVVLKEFILPIYVDVSIRRQNLEKFEWEARILKQLNHEQIVQLIDFFVEDHRGYLVLEHIDGHSLHEKVKAEGRLQEKVVLELALQMCKMLTYLHELSPPVVHRDFTPDNLILRKDGTLKLVDFNVAQQTESTATGTVVGKHSYLPPEQFRGQPVSQSDIYSMGATLHFLLTGEDPEAISVSRPRRQVSELSEELDLIVAKATAIEVKDRYHNAQDLEADLEALSRAQSPTTSAQAPS